MFHISPDQRSIDEVADGVYLADLAVTDRAGMTFWHVEPGATLPAHRHDNDQIGFVIEGSMTAIVEGEEIPLNPGDSYAFPGGEHHGAENRTDAPCTGIGVLVPPREEPEWRTTAAEAESEAAGDD